MPIDDVVEVSNYVAALEYGLRRLEGGFPLSGRLIREIHGVLLARGRGSAQQPGEFRRSQNWIGGSRPGDAAFVPPPHTFVAECMTNLEQFIHDESLRLPALLRAGVAHLQFETIHPFLDGNGRVGRLLIGLILWQARALQQPLLYLSLFFKKNRRKYYELLDSVRRDGDWESWLEFFLDGVRETADGAIDTARRLGDLFREHTVRVSQGGRRAGSALRIFAVLKERPIVTLAEVQKQTGLTFPTVGAAMHHLIDLGVVRELTGRRRDRAFAYDSYLEILNAGTE